MKIIKCQQGFHEHNSKPTDDARVPGMPSGEVPQAALQKQFGVEGFPFAMNPALKATQTRPGVLAVVKLPLKAGGGAPAPKIWLGSELSGFGTDRCSPHPTWPCSPWLPSSWPHGCPSCRSSTCWGGTEQHRASTEYYAVPCINQTPSFMADLIVAAREEQLTQLAALLSQA
eukprot:67446-Pelagomonas_calceolata.AAC.3